MTCKENTNKSAFSKLYKPLVTVSDQNTRREILLNEQKQLRNNAFDVARNIEENNSDTEVQPNTTHYKKRQNYFKKFCDGVMLSEWMVEVPEDLDISWYIKKCPVGKRNVVIAYKNKTKSFSRTGRFEYEFNSVLPGGIISRDVKSKHTVLDCVWEPETKVFYVLDCLVWNGFDFTNCDAEFRFYWLKLQFAENPNLQLMSSCNEYPFHYIEHEPFEFLGMKDMLNNFPVFENNIPAIDGVLFYHKEAIYVPRRTPLVGWLKPFMFPEILNIPVAAEYEMTKPKMYKDLRSHIEYSSKAKLKKLKKNKSGEMEVDVEKESNTEEALMEQDVQ